jgi:hypothetical protein
MKKLAAAEHVERFYAVDESSDRIPRNGERRSFSLQADDRNRMGWARKISGEVITLCQ